MFIFGYLRASPSEQDASRAKNVTKAFGDPHGHRIAGWDPRPSGRGGCQQYRINTLEKHNWLVKVSRQS